MSDEKKPDLTPETAPEPVDTAAAMQYFEAAEAAAEVGREILASRKPKKPKKQKKQKEQKHLEIRKKSRTESTAIKKTENR